MERRAIAAAAAVLLTLSHCGAAAQLGDPAFSVGPYADTQLIMRPDESISFLAVGKAVPPLLPVDLPPGPTQSPQHV